jgi:hypothetical protein
MICLHDFSLGCANAGFGFKKVALLSGLRFASEMLALPYWTVTTVPTGISEKNLRAVSSGKRIQPCDAG